MFIPATQDQKINPYHQKNENMAKNDQYFPHDYQARNDVKCLFLRQQLGMEGYGIFWFLIESLADAGGVLPMKIIPVLAMQMQLPEIKVQAVINNFELFELIDDGFFSLRLNKHLELRNMLSVKGREGAQKRWINSPPISPPNAKERKVKEIKGNEINIVFDFFWNEYDKKVGLREKIKKKWEELTDTERETAMQHIPKYKQSQPDKKYRKDPATYLNNKSFNDEIINNGTNNNRTGGTRVGKGLTEAQLREFVER